MYIYIYIYTYIHTYAYRWHEFASIYLCAVCARNADILRRVRVLHHAHNCSVYLLYWYKVTNTGTEVQILTYCNV